MTLGNQSLISIRRQGLTVHKEVVFFIMEAYTDKVELSFEHVGYIWLDYQHALEKLTFKNSKDVLQKAHDFLKKKGIITDVNFLLCHDKPVSDESPSGSNFSADGNSGARQSTDRPCQLDFYDVLSLFLRFCPRLLRRLCEVATLRLG